MMELGFRLQHLCNDFLPSHRRKPTPDDVHEIVLLIRGQFCNGSRGEQKIMAMKRLAKVYVVAIEIDGRGCAKATFRANRVT